MLSPEFVGVDIYGRKDCLLAVILQNCLWSKYLETSRKASENLKVPDIFPNFVPIKLRRERCVIDAANYGKEELCKTVRRRQDTNCVG